MNLERPEAGRSRPGAEHATDRYWLVVGGLGAMFVAGAIFPDGAAGRMTQSVLAAFVFFATYRAAGVSRRRARLMILILTVVGVVLVASSFSDNEVMRGISLVVIGLLVGGGPVVLVRRIFERSRVTIDEIAAAFSAYVQIGLFFAFLYAGSAQLSAAPFFVSQVTPRFGDFLYFSIVTITTLGYGDLAPATGVGRSLVMMETLIGQVFLVVLVARLVAQLGQRRDDGAV